MADHELTAALVAAMAELENVPKTNTAKVGAYSYNYADLGDTLTYVRPVLARHGLGVSQEVSGDGATITVVTVIWHESGETYRTPGLTLRAGVTAQETGSAITYARRYSLLPALGLATEDDDGAQANRQQLAATALAKNTIDRLRMAKGKPVVDEVKALAAATDKYMETLGPKTLRELADDPEWRAQVDQLLDSYHAVT